MAHKHIQGQNVNLLIDGNVIAASESCDFSLSSNTVDAAAKDDPGLGDWDNPQFDKYTWSCSNQSFIVDVDSLGTFIANVCNGSKMAVVLNVSGATASAFTLTGQALVTGLDIDAPADGFAKMTISMEGASALTPGTGTAPAAASTIASRIKGKALMVAIKTGTGDGATYKTAMCATGHKLSVSIQTSDVTDKDTNDSVVDKEVTGKSFTLTTDNLIPATDASNQGLSYSDIMSALVSGTVLDVSFGYYPNCIGVEATNHNWGRYADGVIIDGKYICTSFQISGQVKNTATYSATFSGKGQPTIAT